MDILRIKNEMDEEEITIEYNDVSKDQAHLTETLNRTNSSEIIQPKNESAIKPLEKKAKALQSKYVRPKVFNKNISTSIHVKHRKAFTPASSGVIISKKVALAKTEMKNSKGTTNNVCSVNPIESQKPTFKQLYNNSSKELPHYSYTKPIHPLHFSGARFVHTQVHSNLVLQTLLKDIISLNNEKDEVNADAINKEVASLRAKNNLPSLNAEVNVPVNLEFEDSDFLDGSEDESYSYYNTKTSENYGKDSGYDNESQHSESLEDDPITEVQDNLGNTAEKSLVLAEPEYIDLDKYFGSEKRTITVARASLMDLQTIAKSYQPGYKSINRLNRNTTKLTCSICNKTLMSKRTYKKHTKNGTGCIKTPSKDTNLIGACKSFGTKENFLKHRQEKHSTTITVKAVPTTCVQCQMSFTSRVALTMHYKDCHKQKMSCLFCDCECENLTEYNLHIANKHSKRDKKDSTSSESDCLEIVEIDDEDC